MVTTTSLIVAWVAIACSADMFFKAARSVEDPNFFWGVFLYATSGIFAMATYKRAEFASVAIVWIAISLLLSLLISVVYYQERFTATRATAAVLLMIVAILLEGRG